MDREAVENGHSQCVQAHFQNTSNATGAPDPDVGAAHQARLINLNPITLDARSRLQLSTLQSAEKNNGAWIFSNNATGQLSSYAR